MRLLVQIIMVLISLYQQRRRSTQLRINSLILILTALLVSLQCSLDHPERTTTSKHGICLVRAEDDGETEDVVAEYEDTEEEEEDEAIIDAMTGERILLHDDDSVYAPYTNSFSRNNEERDQNLHLMTYDVGDGEQTTYVYVEPTIEAMYQSDIDGLKSKQHVKRVTPQFNGFAGKFINMSNKKCTLYWYVYLWLLKVYAVYFFTRGAVVKLIFMFQNRILFL